MVNKPRDISKPKLQHIGRKAKHQAYMNLIQGKKPKEVINQRLRQQQKRGK